MNNKHKTALIVLLVHYQFTAEYVSKLIQTIVQSSYTLSKIGREMHHHHQMVTYIMMSLSGSY